MPAMRLRANTATLWAASLAAAGRPAPSSLDTLTLAAPVMAASHHCNTSITVGACMTAAKDNPTGCDIGQLGDCMPAAMPG